MLSLDTEVGAERGLLREGGMASVVVERTFDAALTDSDLEHMMTRVSPCLDACDARWICSYFSVSRQRMICLFEAADAESVRRAFRVAGLPFESVWRGDVLAPDAG